MPTDKLLLLQKLRHLLGLFETRRIAVASKVLGVDEENLRQTIKDLQSHFDARLFQESEGELLPTAAGAAVHRYLLSAIDEMERRISVHASSNDMSGTKQKRVIGAHAANPLTRSVLPDFVEQLSQSTPFDFSIKGFASQADLIRALRAREVHFAVMLPPKRGHVDKPSIGMAPFSPQRAVVCIYAMRFAMISFRQTGLASLGDLVRQRVATGFGPNSLVDEYLDAFLQDHVGGRENILPVPCENIADAMQRLRAREIAATPFPLDGIKITSLARGLVRPLEGMLSRATIQKITHDHPGLRVRCTELFGNRNVTMIETPIIIYAAQDMAEREVHVMIAAAKDFFRFYIKHRYGKMPPAGFFDPSPLGLMTHPASAAHFGHSQVGALH